MIGNQMALEAIFEPILEVLFFTIGKFVLPIISLGCVRSASLKDEKVHFSQWRDFIRGHGTFTKDTDGKWLVSCEITILIGVVVVLAALAILCILVI